MGKIVIHMSDGPDGPYCARVVGCSSKSHAALLVAQANAAKAYDYHGRGLMTATTREIFAGHYPPVEVRGRLVR